MPSPRKAYVFKYITVLVDPMSFITFAPTVVGPGEKRKVDAEHAERGAVKRLQYVNVRHARSTNPTAADRESIFKPSGPLKFRFIKPPTLHNGIWVWPHLYVDDAGKKGNGVFAKEDIPRGLLIPYAGELWMEDEYYDNKFKSDREIAYALGGRLSGMTLGDSKLALKTIVSADPDSHICRSQFCIAGMVNEASEDAAHELYNAEFVDLPVHQAKLMPRYGAFVRGLSSFLLTTTDIKKDEEILCWYGDKYDRGPGYVVKARETPNLADHAADADTLERFRRLKSSDRIEVEGSNTVAPKAPKGAYRYVYKNEDVNDIARAIGMSHDSCREHMKSSYLYDWKDRLATSRRNDLGVKLDVPRLKTFQSVWAYLPANDTCEWMGGIVIGKTRAGHALVFIMNTWSIKTVTQLDLDTVATIDAQDQYVWQAMVDANGETDGKGPLTLRRAANLGIA